MVGNFAHRLCFILILLASFIYPNFQTSDVSPLLKYLVFCPEWTAAVRLLHFLNIQNFLMWRTGDFRKCNKQLLIHLMWVFCWCVYHHFLMGLAHPRNSNNSFNSKKTSHIIQINFLSAVTVSRYTDFSKQEYLFCLKKNFFPPLLASDYLLLLCTFLLIFSASCLSVSSVLWGILAVFK